MADIDANFSLSSQSLNAGFELSETNVDAVFKINAAGTTWGSIEGTLSNQTDLQNALTTLQTNINNEGIARANADLLLETSINNHIADKTNPHEVTKSQVGLGNVDNTSDLNKPISTATQNALNNKQNTISDLSTIRNNADKGQLAYQTQQTYGNIVTHNTSEFATSQQGQLANSALQSGDNVSELVNDANYVTTSYHDSTKQNVLTAGNNIQITNNTISATDTTYTAGNGIILNGTQINANVVNSVASTSITNALSANMGNELQQQINNLKSRGRYLSIWNCANGLATTTPTVLPYTYRTGDYFVVGTVSTINYKPNGLTYTGIASTTVEESLVAVGDTYYFDGTNWNLLHSGEVEVTFAQIGGLPEDNLALETSLNAKQDTLTAGTNIGITNNTISFTGTIPTKISDLTDDTATNPIDKADTLTGLTASITELNYTDGVTSNIQTQINSKQNTLTAGSNIQINNNTISATDTTYTAGTGISIVDNVISNTQTSAEWGNITGTLSNQSDLNTALNGKQDTLVSGTNIKTINNTSILGSGDITIQSAPPLDNTTINQNSSNQLQAIGVIDGKTGNADKFVSLTKVQYDALATKDADTFYNITDDSDVTLNLLQTIYPVGSLYLTTANTCPLSALFGTWQLQSEDIPNCVIETGTSNGISYRIWQDGYCEQWGVYTPTTNTIGQSGSTVILLKTFKDTNYSVQANQSTGNTTDNFSNNDVLTQRRSGSDIGLTQYGSYGHPISWKASGYLAEGQYTPKTQTTKTFKRIA